MAKTESDPADEQEERKVTTAQLPKLKADDVQALPKRPVRVTPGSIVFVVINKDPAEASPPITVETGYIILGRSAPGALTPTIDFNEYRGYALGVSRQHAAIRRVRASTYTIEDLRSANGTWVNDERLDSLTPRELQNGDRIQLGQLLIDVFFEESAASN
jgi:hypothetical protein